MESIIDEIIHSTEMGKIPSDFSSIPFIEAIWPWIHVARTRLEQRTDLHRKLLSPEAYSSLEGSLLKRWSKLCSTFMLHEMEIDQMLPHHEYLNFIHSHYLDRESLSHFFSTYREMTRLVSTLLFQWIDYILEFLSRLQRDFDQKFGKVISLNRDLGDFHNGGKSVSILTFESGMSLVYKPKNQAVAQAYFSFLKQLNEVGLDPPLNSYVLITKEGYSWEERVEHKHCQNLSEVENYYIRSGMILCLMNWLQGTDFHAENIIASGENPQLIDLEALFHSEFSIFKKKDDSVMDIGLLPSFPSHINQAGLISLSGKVPFDAPQWEHINTSDMRIVFGPRSSRSHHHVIFNNEKMVAENFVESIIEGFRRMYSFSERHNALFIFWISEMAKHPVRIIFRPSTFYAMLISKLNSFAGEKALDHLNKYYTQDHPDFHLVIENEKRALLQRDIPSFYVSPYSQDLFSNHGLVAKSFLKNTPYETVISRFSARNEIDRNLQERLIRQSLQSPQESFS